MIYVALLIVLPPVFLYFLGLAYECPECHHSMEPVQSGGKTCPHCGYTV